MPCTKSGVGHKIKCKNKKRSIEEIEHVLFKTLVTTNELHKCDMDVMNILDYHLDYLYLDEFELKIQHVFLNVFYLRRYIIKKKKLL